MRVISLLLLLLITACYGPAQNYVFVEVGYYDQPVETSRKKILEYLNNNKLKVAYQDSRAIYLILPVQNNPMFDCGYFGGYEARDEIEGNAKVEILITETKPESSRVRVMSAIDKIPYHDPVLNGDMLVKCHSKGKLEAAILDYIGERQN